MPYICIKTPFNEVIFFSFNVPCLNCLVYFCIKKQTVGLLRTFNSSHTLHMKQSSLKRFSKLGYVVILESKTMSYIDLFNLFLAFRVVFYFCFPIFSLFSCIMCLTYHMSWSHSFPLPLSFTPAPATSPTPANKTKFKRRKWKEKIRKKLKSHHGHWSVAQWTTQ